MPAKDRYHDTVKRALVKDGWKIIREQVTFIVEKRQVQIDLSVSKANVSSTELVFIEIKSFIRRSAVEDLAHAIGKYLLYRLVLEEIGVEPSMLYLAIPQAAFTKIFSEPLGKLAHSRFNLLLLVVDMEQEEIIQWVP